MIRVASYNVRALKDENAALGRVIAALRADVLCVQESPSMMLTRRWRALPRIAGMRVAVRARTGGTAILVGEGVAVLHAEHRRLRWFPWLEWRGIAVAVVEAGGLRLAVVSAHLDLHLGARLWHATEIVARLEALAAEYDAVPVVAGDFNEQPADAAWRYFVRRYTDAFDVSPNGHGPTFTARDPQKRIDAVFVGGGLTVMSCGAPEVSSGDLAAASDHLPVVAEIAT